MCGHQNTFTNNNKVITHMKTKRIITGSAMMSLLFTNACSSTFIDRIAGNESGYVNINADAQGMDAFGNILTGLVNETKTPEGQESAYWQHEKAKTNGRALQYRINKIGVKNYAK